MLLNLAFIKCIDYFFRLKSRGIYILWHAYILL